MRVTRQKMRSVTQLPNIRSTFSLALFVGSILLLCSFGCGGPPSGDGAQDPSAASTAIPEITDDLIRERINDTWIREVPHENGTTDPISWSFDEDEPKEIGIIDKQVNDTKATIVLDIKTGSSPRARTNRHLAGQIRTEWELRTGWVLRRWEIVDTENISMKYKDLPKPPATNQNESR